MQKIAANMTNILQLRLNRALEQAAQMYGDTPLAIN